MLTIRQLTRPGLEPVDLSIEAGECVALSGPSGAGKSILMRAIVDLDPNEGDIRLDDAARGDIPAPRWRRLVAYVPPDSGWWADDVASHFPDADAARRLLPRLGLPAEALVWPVARLSTGERQRLALARALLVEPRVLLLDEPTSGLDQETALKVEDVLRERLADGVAILLVTHDPGQIRRLAGRRLRMKEGKVTEDASAPAEDRMEAGA